MPDAVLDVAIPALLKAHVDRADAATDDRRHGAVSAAAVESRPEPITMTWISIGLPMSFALRIGLTSARMSQSPTNRVTPQKNMM